MKGPCCLVVNPLGTAGHCTGQTYSTYAMCDGVLLWQIVKIPGLKVPNQYSLVLIAQQPCGLGHLECLVTARHKLVGRSN